MEPPIENNAAPSVDVPRLVRLSVGAPAQAKLGTSAWFASLAGVHQMTTKNGLPIIARFEQREDGRVICRARINLEAEWEAREAMDDTCDAISMCAGKLQRAVDGLTANVQAVEPMTMTRKEAIKELKLEQENGDTEAAHGTADDVLCNLLIALGYEDVVDEYNKVDKRYA